MIEAVVVIIILFILLGLPWRIDVDTYRICNKKISNTIKVCILSDLHCRTYGRKQAKIRKLLEKEKPDIIVIPGDLFDVDRNYEYAFDLVEACKGYLTFYTTGNHDAYLKNDLSYLIQRLKNMNVHVLQNENECIQVKGEMINIIGLNDQGRQIKITPNQLKTYTKNNMFNILLSHRPNYISFYNAIEVDLIISGHAHGGQARIPFTHQGIYAPQQGLLPKYTEGIHNMRYAKFAISRGFASGKPFLPRFYNNPEMMIIEIENEK